MEVVFFMWLENIREEYILEDILEFIVGMFD